MMNAAQSQRNRAIVAVPPAAVSPRPVAPETPRQSEAATATNTAMETAKPRLIDMHVHMVGNGGGGSGGWLRLNGWHRWLAGFMLRQLGIPASALEGDLESIYAE